MFLFCFGYATSFDVPSTSLPAGYTTASSTHSNLLSMYKIVSGSTSTENPTAISSGLEATANVLAAFSGGAAAVPTPMRRFSRMTLLGTT